jgi:hypothetical protein
VGSIVSSATGAVGSLAGGLTSKAPVAVPQVSAPPQPVGGLLP